MDAAGAPNMRFTKAVVLLHAKWLHARRLMKNRRGFETRSTSSEMSHDTSPEQPCTEHEVMHDRTILNYD
jgi:hypothetical protein